MDRLDNLYEQDGIVVRRAISEDAIYLGDKLRQSDIDEIKAVSDRTPYEALKRSLDTSIFCCTILNGNPIGMFGIAPDNLLGYKASVWFLASDSLDKIKRRFAKNSKNFIDLMLEFYPYLYNYVDDRNKASIKWLRLCGAKMEEPKPYGKNSLPFRYFSFEKGVKHV